jgi:organic hydroperoxide reductase OsmC/OhrA
MSEHKTWLCWRLETESFDYATYNREHEARFEGGASLRASSAAQFLGSAELPNPEDLLVAALSSCHMLTFLAIASKRGFSVERYDDAAVGFLEKNAKGKLAVTRVVLRPHVVFRGQEPEAATLTRMHESSHRECFIASSVLTEITVEPR